MQLYKFDPHISKNRVIQMPSNQQLNDQYVQIVILTKQEFKSNRIPRQILSINGQDFFQISMLKNQNSNT